MEELGKKKKVEGLSLEELDALIGEAAEHWRVERMTMVDRNILRLGAFELAHRPDVPLAVAIDEAVELAKRFSTDDSGRFVMPEHLRELGKVEDGLYFQAAGDFFFVWNPEELARMGPEWKSAQAACAKLMASAR